MLLLLMLTCPRRRPCCLPSFTQIVLGYISDTRSMAAARQVCKSWHAASSAATATVSVSLPGNIQDMRSKLALLLHVSAHQSVCS